MHLYAAKKWKSSKENGFLKERSSQFRNPDVHTKILDVGTLRGLLYVLHGRHKTLRHPIDHKVPYSTKGPPKLGRNCSSNIRSDWVFHREGTLLTLSLAESGSSVFGQTRFDNNLTNETRGFCAFSFHLDDFVSRVNWSLHYYRSYGENWRNLSLMRRPQLS